MPRRSLPSLQDTRQPWSTRCATKCLFYPKKPTPKLLYLVDETDQPQEGKNCGNGMYVIVFVTPLKKGAPDSPSSPSWPNYEIIIWTKNQAEICSVHPRGCHDDDEDSHGEAPTDGADQPSERVGVEGEQQRVVRDLEDVVVCLGGDHRHDVSNLLEPHAHGSLGRHGGCHVCGGGNERSGLDWEFRSAASGESGKRGRGGVHFFCIQSEEHGRNYGRITEQDDSKQIDRILFRGLQRWHEF